MILNINLSKIVNEIKVYIFGIYKVTLFFVPFYFTPLIRTIPSVPQKSKANLSFHFLRLISLAIEVVVTYPKMLHIQQKQKVFAYLQLKRLCSKYICVINIQRLDVVSIQYYKISYKQMYDISCISWKYMYNTLKLVKSETI